MTDIAIRAENLGKLYRIGKRERYKTLRETLTDAVYAPLRRIRSAFQRPSVPASQHPNGDNTIWALKDVSFEIKRGDIVGIIGRNGSGKSTLLKILSRITEPTEGTAEIHGRVGSLLEVGTGFHPELTGRENIYLNGAILGMKRVELYAKFDEIVAFAEVEKFIDTPVKHYSSGMHVRLAFAVAAHLEPEILLVDEVLAVGDIAFQKKCLGRMGRVAREGQTVLFVSHNMAAISELCGTTCYLQDGRVKASGSTDQVVPLYIASGQKYLSEVLVPESKHQEQYGGDGGALNIRLVSVRLLNNQRNTFSVRWKEPLELLLEINVSRLIENVVLSLAVTSILGVTVLASHHTDQGDDPLKLYPGRYEFKVHLENPLQAGLYLLAIGAHNAISRDVLFLVPEVVTFEVLDISVDSTRYLGKHNAVVNSYAKWNVS